MPDQFTDLYDLFRIQSDRRLIEYNDLRIPQDRLCKPDTLPVSLGQIADGYKGFALEYDFRKCIYKYTNINLNVNLFPVIYTDILPDFTLEEGNLYVRECFSKLDVNNVWSYMLDINCPFNQLYFYKAYLYKDRKEYSHECEWRMLYYNIEDDNDYVSIPDVECLKAIYYGPDIKYENKERLHKIAMEKGIKEYEVYLDTETRDYSLQVKLLKE